MHPSIDPAVAPSFQETLNLNQTGCEGRTVLLHSLANSFMRVVVSLINLKLLVNIVRASVCSKIKTIRQNEVVDIEFSMSLVFTQ